MLLAVLKLVRWPFNLRRLWLTVPFALGAISIAIGSGLLAPFVFGYDATPSISFTSVAPCGKDARVYAVALTPTRFVIAIAPNDGDVTVDSTDLFLSVANNLETQEGPQLSYGVDFCKNWDFEVSTEDGTQVHFVGAYVGSRFLSQINEFRFDDSAQSYLGYAPIKAKDPGVNSSYLWDARLNIKKKALQKSLIIKGHNVAIVYEEASLSEVTPHGNRTKKSFRVEALPQQVQVPAGNMQIEPLDFNNPKPPVLVNVGITGAVFVVDCNDCKGRAGYGSRLAIAMSHWKDWDLGFLGGPTGTNRIIAATTPLWTSIPDPEYHGKREPVGKHWWSLGSPDSETSSFSGSHSETIDVFRWERRSWLDREQSITLFASILLGLGVTLWTELLIIFLHSISPPTTENRSDLSHKPTKNPSEDESDQ